MRVALILHGKYIFFFKEEEGGGEGDTRVSYLHFQRDCCQVSRAFLNKISINSNFFIFKYLIIGVVKFNNFRLVKFELNIARAKKGLDTRSHKRRLLA
jgi:hypothetical protein